MNIRNKGKRGEREVAELLDSTWEKIQRKKDPSGPILRIASTFHDKGADLYSIEGLAIEVKRHETLNLNSWWRQAEIQADNLGAIPIVMYRQNRKAWSVMLPAYLLVVGASGYLITTWEVFEVWLEHYLSRSVR